MSTETSKELMRVYLEEVLGNRNFNLIPDIAAADLVDSTQPSKTGPDALDAHARGFCQNTPDVEIEVIKIFAEGNTAVGIWRWSGEPTHPSTVSAKGSPVSPRLICSVFEVEDGKIKDYRVFIDAMDVFMQLMQ